MQFGFSRSSLSQAAFLFASFLFVPLVGHTQTPASTPQTQASSSAVIPDAQIEANVLKAFAGAPELADQKITTTTIYGEVTLGGSVKDEPTRVLAETLASHAQGVKKVIDELTLLTDPVSAPSTQGNTAADTNPNLQSNGTMAQQQAPPPNADGAPVTQQPPSSPNYGPGAPEYPQQQPYSGSPYPAPQVGQRSYPPPPASYPPGQEPYGAQQAGQLVVIPNGAMLRIRINQGLSSQSAQPGAAFEAIVLNDVVADGAVAIPRGATVQGSVVEAKNAGALTGRAELTLQLNQVTLAGKTFPLVSDSWTNVGADKTLRSVNSALGLGAVGAMIGAVAGGGPGAAIGAAAGGVAGLGTSAAAGGGQVLIPAEAILTFHLTQPASVTTVSQAEMDRLSYGVPVGGQQQPRLVRRPGYYGPGYYPRPAYYPYPPPPGYYPYPY